MKRNNLFTILLFIGFIILAYLLITKKDNAIIVDNDKIDKLEKEIDSLKNINLIYETKVDSLTKIKESKKEVIKIIKEKEKNEKFKVENLSDSLSIVYFNEYIKNYSTK